GQDLLGHIVDRAVHDLVDEADVSILARSDPRHDLAPRHFRIDYGLASATAIVDHHDKIFHAPNISDIRNQVKQKILKIRNLAVEGANQPAAGPDSPSRTDVILLPSTCARGKPPWPASARSGPVAGSRRFRRSIPA